MADTIELLIANGVITRELAQRAAQIPAHISSTRVGQLIAAGTDANPLLQSLAGVTGIPVAPRMMVDGAMAVPLLPSTARKLLDLVACPVQRDAQGTLHLLIAEPEAVVALDKMLSGFKVYLATEVEVRALLHRLYSLTSVSEGAPIDNADAIDIDIDASRRIARAPARELAPIDIDLEATQRMVAASALVPPPLAIDPLAARPSGAFKRVHDDDETQRIPRSPRAPTKVPAPAPTVAVLDDRTLEGPALTPLAAATQRAFLRGLLLGAGGTAVLAAIVIIALLAR